MTWTESVRKAGASEISSAVLRFILVYSTPIGELNCFNFSTAQFSALLRLTAMHSDTCWPCPCLRRPHDRAHSRQKTLLAWRKSNEVVADTTCKWQRIRNAENFRIRRATVVANICSIKESQRLLTVFDSWHHATVKRVLVALPVIFIYVPACAFCPTLYFSILSHSFFLRTVSSPL